MFADANCFSKRNANGYTYSYVYDYSHCYANSDRYGYRHTERYGYCDSEHYGYSYEYTYRYTLSDSDGHGQADAYCAPAVHTEATSHTAAAPLRKLAWRFWGAGASRVLVSASRRNELSECVTTDSALSEREKVRDGEDAIASTRDACATQQRGHSQTETMSLD